MIVALPSPNAFPIGSRVRVGPYRGQVVEIRGPWSVVLELYSGGRGRLVTTTTDLELDRDLDQAAAPEAPPAGQPDLFA